VKQLLAIMLLSATLLTACAGMPMPEVVTLVPTTTVAPSDTYASTPAPTHPHPPTPPQERLSQPIRPHQSHLRSCRLRRRRPLW
jgi:hypothetical protein